MGLAAGRVGWGEGWGGRLPSHPFPGHGPTPISSFHAFHARTLLAYGQSGKKKSMSREPSPSTSAFRAQAYSVIVMMHSQEGTGGEGQHWGRMMTRYTSCTDALLHCCDAVVGRLLQTQEVRLELHHACVSRVHSGSEAREGGVPRLA